MNNEYYKLVECTDSDKYTKSDTLLVLGKTFDVIELGRQAANKKMHKIEGKNNVLVIDGKSYMAIVMTIVTKEMTIVEELIDDDVEELTGCC